MILNLGPLQIKFSGLDKGGLSLTINSGQEKQSKSATGQSQADSVQISINDSGLSTNSSQQASNLFSSSSTASPRATTSTSAIQEGSLSAKGFQWPLPKGKGEITSPFGWRTHPITGEKKHHNGIDIAGETGTPILAAAGGEVDFVGFDSGYGNIVDIKHPNGLITRYAHLNSSSAKVGKEVKAGQQIGELGNTGRSTGPHLHFEVRGDALDNKTVLNPSEFLPVA